MGIGVLFIGLLVLLFTECPLWPPYWGHHLRQPQSAGKTCWQSFSDISLR